MNSCQAYAFKHRNRLTNLINDVWAWETVDETLVTARESRIDGLRRAAAPPCMCNGVWSAAVAESFMSNGIDPVALCTDVLNALHLGRSPTAPLLALAGALGGEGKSLFLKAFLSIYGDDNVFQPPDKSNFPLMGLSAGPKVAFLDEWRFVNPSVSFAQQCLWFDGSGVPVARPQNVRGAEGHFMYRGSAPVFITTKLDYLEALSRNAAVDPSTGRPYSAEASMLMRRMKVYPFMRRIAAPPATCYCARCFASLVLNQARVW